MTPLKPIESMVGVKGVVVDRYEPNEICAHPECHRPTESVHHIFGRPPGTHSDSFYVEIPMGGSDFVAPGERGKLILPHATGLCGNGTMGHHGDIDSGMGGHQAWIRLEWINQKPIFVWYDRLEGPGGEVEWNRLGPLDPQPGPGAQKKRRRKTAEERKTRRTISIAIPKDAQENGGEIWDDLFGNGKDGKPYGRVREAMNEAFGDRDDNPKAVGNRSEYYLIVDVCNDWLNS